MTLVDNPTLPGIARMQYVILQRTDGICRLCIKPTLIMYKVVLVKNVLTYNFYITIIIVKIIFNMILLEFPLKSKMLDISGDQRDGEFFSVN